ncbi:MAG TPA: hypothetical protein VHM24_07840, partial [Gemmatimonadaceae bacterium]|nr:hypothetical protein [Gemmatimonadaceae bacterium]
GAYVVLLVTLAFRHEMWRDEVRAFSVATRAASWGQMLSDLHHEGHPALWYIMLRAGYAITRSSLVLPITAILVAVAAAYLILRYAPFPFWLRLLAVFGAFLGFELSIVARNYGIGVLLMVAACVMFGQRRTQPWYPAICLALMANTSVHAALASLVLVLVWISDAFNRNGRRTLFRRASIGSIALVVASVSIAFATARPTSDMAWAFSPAGIDTGHVLRTMVTDPGLALHGVLGANVAAAGEFPWRYLSIDPEAASRIIVDVVLLWLAWSLRSRPVHLIAMLVTIIGFEVLFREVYSGALRHEGIIAFLLFSICWLAQEQPGRETRESPTIALGLLPLFAIQAAALPFVAQRYFFKPASASKGYGAFLESHPRYRDAILMSEPDYMMEALPYYSGNRVYMPRQREFHYRVYFDRGQKRIQHLSLDRLLTIADSVACAHEAPVLLALANTEISWKASGTGRPQYKGATFWWTEGDRIKLYRRGRLVASFPESISDEYYHVFEIAPACKSS